MSQDNNRLICPICGRENQSSSHFCVFCGTNIYDLIDTESPQSTETEVLELRRWLAQLTQRIISLETKVGDISGKVNTTPSDEMPVQSIQPTPDLVNVGVLASDSRSAESQLGEEVRIDPSASEQRKGNIDWEYFIGLNWIAIAGAVTLSLGIGFFLKIAFDYNWINQTGRVLLGLATGISLVVVGEYFHRKYPIWSRPVTGAGISIMYLSVYSAFAFFDIVPPLPAFFVLAGLVFVSGFLALRYESRTIAILGLFGAFATPVLLEGEIDTETYYIMVSAYIILVDLGILFVSSLRNWPYFVLVGLIFSYILVGRVWDDSSLSLQVVIISQILATFVFLIFVGSTNLFHLIWRQRSTPNRLDLSIMIFNAFLFYVVTLNYWDNYDSWFGAVTALIGLFYLLLGYFTTKETESTAVLSLYSFSISIIFATIAIPVQFSGHWLGAAWFAEGATFIWLGFMLKTWKMRVFGLAVLVVASLYTVLYSIQLDTESFKPLLNEIFPVFLFGAASLFVASFAYQKFGGRELQGWELLIVKHSKTPMNIALGITGSFLVIYAFTIEIIYYFEERKIGVIAEGQINELTSKSLLAITVVWSLCFAVLIVISFLIQSKQLRIASVILILVAAVKFLFVDTPEFYQLDFIPIINNSFVASLVLTMSVALGGYLYWKNMVIIDPIERNTHVILLVTVNILSVFMVSAEVIRFFDYRDMLSNINSDSAKILVLTVFWALYSIGVIGSGIWKSVKEIRIVGLVLLFLVLFKLFAFDVRELETGYRVVAFISLGILLLATGLMYQKYSAAIKGIILGNDNEGTDSHSL